jgi:arylsulfatase A-like enzyme
VNRELLQIVASAACVLALAACRESRSPPNAGRSNVILINIDTLRADHLGCYGYPQRTSPVIDRLASEGVVFTDAAANSSYTRESVSALFSGMLPSHAGAAGWDAHPSNPSPTLAEVLHGAGYQTAFLDLTTMLAHESFARGFDQVEHLTKRGRVSRKGPQLSQRTLDLIAALDPQRPYFVYLHYLDPHGPYDPPPDALDRFGGNLVETPLDLYRDLRPHLPELRRQGFQPGSPAFLDVVRRYDAEVFDTDRAVGRLLEGLRQRGALEHTMVVVTADHGEEFLEHDFVEHSWTLYEESIRVPLIFWAPGHLASTRVAGRVSTVDIYPTILGLLDVDFAVAGLDGKSLFTSGGGERRPADLGDREQISEVLIAERNVVRAVCKGKWKYLSALRWLEPEERPAAAAIPMANRAAVRGPTTGLWGPAIHEELYDLTLDPGESHNLAASEPGVARQMSEIFLAYRSRCTSPPAPSRTLTEEEAEAMRALGY